MSKLLPSYYCKNIFLVPLSFYGEKGIKHIFCDLDNTLDGYDVLTPSTRVINLVNALKQIGITLHIISNNKQERVEKYASLLNTPYLYKSGKPFGKKIDNYINTLHINKDEILFVGDQIMTDVKAANRIRVKVLLTEKIVTRDQLVTKFNRFFDIIIRKMIKKKLKKLEVEVYGTNTKDL